MRNFLTILVACVISIGSIGCGSGGSKPVVATTPLAQTITFGALPNVTYGVGPITLGATASSGLPVSYAVTSGPATLSASTLTITGAGRVTVTATQAGNGSYTAAQPVPVSFTVTPAVLMVTAKNASMASGQSVPALTYAVTGFVNGDTSAVVSGTATETTAATSSSPAGTYPITFSAEGLTAANYTFSYVSGTLTATGGAVQTITFGAPPNVTYGVGPITLGATASSGLPVSYAVTSGPATLSASTLTITGAGRVTVTATQAGNGSYAAAQPVPVSFTVTPAVLMVTAKNASMASGQSVPALTYAVTGFVNGDTSAVVSGTATETTAATSSSPAGTYPITFSVEGLTAANYTFSYVSGMLTVGSAASLTQIVITPTSATLNINQAHPLKAIGTYSDNSTQDLTLTVTWFSASPSVASVTVSSGVATLTALSAGPTTISASLGSVQGSASITVNAPTLTSIVVNPSAASIPTGTSQAFTATGFFSDGSSSDITNTVQWASDNLAVATMNANVANGLSAGTVHVTATSAAVVSAQATLTVTSAVLQSIDISPDTASVPVGGQVTFTVVGTFSDGSIQSLPSVQYQSSDTTVASIDPVLGVATGVAANANGVTIAATVAGFTNPTTSNTATLIVLPATLESIVISPLNASLTAGSTAQFVLTGTFSDGSTEPLTSNVSWTSSDPAVAGVNANGLVAALATGEAAISAVYNGQVFSGALTVVLGAPTSIAVTPALISVGIDDTKQFTATAVFADGSTQDLTSQVGWTSSAANVALISNTGLASGLSAGTTQIAASYQGVSGSATLTVSTAQLTAIEVLPNNPVVPTHGKIQFTAMGVFSDGSTSPLSGVSWHTSTPSRAMVSSSGLVRTKGKKGSVTVSATLNAMTGSTTVTISNDPVTAVAITPANLSIAPGTTLQFALTGTIDGSQVTLSNSAYWQTSNYLDADISSSGLAAGIAAGQVTISATYQSTTYQTTLTVSGATIISVQVAPTVPSINLGSAQPFTATGTFSDGTTQDVTSVSQWASSDPAVAVVDTTGLASSAGLGTTNITATFNTTASTPAVLTVN